MPPRLRSHHASYASAEARQQAAMSLGKRPAQAVTRWSKGLVSVEDLSETELQPAKTRYQRLVDEVSAEQLSRKPS
jgi:hypothetical protein